MTGNYGLDGKTFDFSGTARLNATVSQMTTGWKSILLKPVDPFFRKNGSGTEVPIKVTGTQSDPHFGLDFHHKDEGHKDNGQKEQSDKDDKDQSQKNDRAHRGKDGLGGN